MESSHLFQNHQRGYFSSSIAPVQYPSNQAGNNLSGTQRTQLTKPDCLATTDLSCPVCSHVLRGSAYLKEHIFKYHPNSAPLSCTLCGRGYQTPRGLAHHMQSHKGKTFMCPVCSVKFTQKFSIKAHLRAVHKLAKCMNCSSVLKIGHEFDQHVLNCGNSCVGNNQMKNWF